MYGLGVPAVSIKGEEKEKSFTGTGISGVKYKKCSDGPQKFEVLKNKNVIVLNIVS